MGEHLIEHILRVLCRVATSVEVHFTASYYVAGVLTRVISFCLSMLAEGESDCSLLTRMSLLTALMNARPFGRIVISSDP